MREKRPPSLKDVAALAGVSSATVSRLLNGTLELPQETRARIDEAIRSLDYSPNPHARRLSRGRSDTIGLVVPDIANPFFATFVAAVEQEADRHGLAVSLHATLNRTEREIAYLDLIARNHLDGLIFVTNHPDDGTLAARISRSGKVVVVDEDVPGAQAPKIFCDNVQGGLLVGRHLATFGHRRVLFLGGPPEMISARRRAEGLRRGLDPEAEITVWHGDYTIEFGRAAAQRFLAERRRERAIFATSDEIVIGLMEVFRERGVSVPADVSIVGFDDVGPLHLFAPAMTAVRQPVSALGRRAVERLLETDWAAPADLHKAELMPIELVVRDSVAPPLD
ncbi:LacI family DNA-binding transcriptional regulator [Segnochrobactrum spirostomi]|uniref:LacI family DNA-binding transcriptional regulator n=1 Tax=Segnochrobactrum spirostomi TaxID=2608987 RepID=UPI0028B04295|nr:LacI family DNA-binding transcriptional regulator [Segnochrobactrum spirostomi]